MVSNPKISNFLHGIRALGSHQLVLLLDLQAYLQAQQLQYGFERSSTISFQLCWLEDKHERILEEETFGIY